MNDHAFLEDLPRRLWESLTADGVHQHLGTSHGEAARYLAHVSPLAGLANSGPGALRDLATLTAPNEVLAIPGLAAVPPGSELELVRLLAVRQFVCDDRVSAPDRTPSPLTEAHWPEMLALARATDPGPFAEGTGQMGGYVGFFADQMLVGMGGERMKFGGYCEVSGVCTDAQHRGLGLAGAIVHWLTYEIQNRGEVPFLHVRVGSPSEHGAAALYQRIGYREVRMTTLALLRRQEHADDEA